MKKGENYRLLHILNEYKNAFDKKNISSVFFVIYMISEGSRLVLTPFFNQINLAYSNKAVLSKTYIRIDYYEYGSIMNMIIITKINIILLN